MSRIGFVLLTHANPPQMLRLVRRLNSMFDHPPIVIHHDFGKCPLPDSFLPENVEFVRPYVKTKWSAFSLVEAMLLALETMYRRSDSPDWCVALSGSCYPTKPAAQILANLTAGGYDAHMEGQEVKPELRDEEWHRMFFNRFNVKSVPYLSIGRRLRPLICHFRLPYVIGRYFLPFHKGFKCYAGSQWFTVSRRAAACIAEFQKTPDAAALAKHYKSILFSDESYLQTALYNARGLNLNPGNWLYLDWSEKKFNPKLLTLSDLDAIQASSAHFARKFDLDRSADLMDALDRIIDGNVVDGDAPVPVLDKGSVVQ